MTSIQPIIARREVTTRILQAFHLKADKNLGQNFLVEETVVNRIARAAELTPDDTVLEIGPGIGTLTQSLALTGAQVVAVELDKRLIPVLQETVGSYANVRVVQGDILKINIPEVVGTKGFKVCANLPYYITTPHYYEFAGTKAAVGASCGHGPKRSGATHDRHTRRAGIWRYFRGDAVLYGAAHRFCGKSRFFPARAKGRQRRIGM